jgi:hypothetical protein
VNPFVFIVGCQRSGTTLLQRVVDAHPQVAVLNQTGWLPSYFEMGIGLTPDGLVTPALVPRVLEHRQFRKGLKKAGLGRADLEVLLEGGAELPYARFVTAVFDLYGRAKGKALVGDKTPRYVRSIGTLHGLWPQARFVHLIRDGRDVCLSTIHWEKNAELLQKAFPTWSEHPVVTAALKWEWNVRLGREAGQPLGPGRYYELRYEALVSQPAEECARLCAFLGVPYDERMLRFYEGRTKAKKGLDAKKGWRPITPGLRDWRTQLPAADLERFEAAAGELLGELGYARGAPRPGSAARQEVARVREAFVRDVRARKPLVPEGW